MGKHFYKNTIANVVKIFTVLKKAEETGVVMTISKIALATGIHKWSVSRTIDIYMSPFVEVTIPEHLEDVGLQLKIVRIKDTSATIEKISNYLKAKNKIQSD